jgi:hypothetical protein
MNFCAKAFHEPLSFSVSGQGEHELTGNEDPNILHAYIAYLPSRVAYREGTHLVYNLSYSIITAPMFTVPVLSVYHVCILSCSIITAPMFTVPVLSCVHFVLFIHYCTHVHCTSIICLSCVHFVLFNHYCTHAPCTSIIMCAFCPVHSLLHPCSLYQYYHVCILSCSFITAPICSLYQYTIGNSTSDDEKVEISIYIVPRQHMAQWHGKVSTLFWVQIFYLYQIDKTYTDKEYGLRLNRRIW